MRYILEDTGVACKLTIQSEAGAHDGYTYRDCDLGHGRIREALSEVASLSQRLRKEELDSA